MRADDWGGGERNWLVPVGPAPLAAVSFVAVEI